MSPMLRFYVVSVELPRAEAVANLDSGAMSPQTTIDVIVMLVIFLALITSLSVLAWRHPVSFSSLRAIPNYEAALPVPNVARPVHSAASHEYSLAYFLHPLDTSFAIHRWWLRASRSHIDRVPSISHREEPVARSRRDRCLYTRATITTTTTTLVEGEAMELREHDTVGGPSTSSLEETNDAEPRGPVVRICEDPVSEVGEAPVPIVCPTVEVDIADVGKVVVGRQTPQ